MKLTIYLFLFALIMSCSSSSKKVSSNKSNTNESFIVDNSDSKIIKNVSYQLWNGGTEASGSGYNTFITLSETDKTIELENIYFRHSKGDIKNTQEGYVAYLKVEKPKDIQLSTNPSDEYKNQLPKDEAFPFQLNDDECIISYFENDRHKFIRVSNVQQLETINYPSAKPKN